MPVIGDPLGFIAETADPWLGQASLYWLGRPGDRMAKLLEIETAAWDGSDRPPFAWCVLKHPQLRKPDKSMAPPSNPYQINEPPERYHSLILFVAPHVKISYPDAQPRVPIKVIRLDDMNSVPSFGQAVQLGDYLGELDLNVITDSNSFARNDFHFLGCRAYRSGLAVVICYAYAGLEIHINLSETEPCLHELQFFCDQSFHHVWYVGATSHVEVKVIQKRVLELVNPPARQMMEFVSVYRHAIDTNDVAELRSPGEAVAKYLQQPFTPTYFKWVVTGSAIADRPLSVFDRSRAYLDGNKFHRVEVVEEDSPARSVFMSAIDVGIGFTVLGPIADLIQIGCMVSTGKDYWGQPVENSDIGLQVVFTLLGGFGDLLKGGAYVAECLGELKQLNNTVFPASALASLNPGTSSAFFGRVFDSLSPSMIAAAERVITKKPANELLGDLLVLRRAANAGDSLSMGALTRAMAEALQVELEALAAVTFIHEAPAFRRFALDTGFLSHSVFDQIAKTNADTIRSLISGARALGDGAGLYEKILQIEPDVARALRDNIRSLTWEKVRSHPGLRQEYKRYALKYRDAKNFDEWALTLTRGKPRQSLRYAFSDNVVSFLQESIAKADGCPPIDELILDPRLVDRIVELMGKMDSYENLREAVEATAPGLGLGRILNADHLIEKRIRIKSMAGLRDTSTYLSKLVVANPQIAAKLQAVGVSDLGNYIHSRKTAYMQALLPHNQEVGFSIQAIADAHQLFFVVTNGMPFKHFLAVFGPEFELLAKDANEVLPALRPGTFFELILRIRDGEQLLLGETKVYERIVGQRASRSIR